MIEKCLLPEWHEDKCVSEKDALKRAEELIYSLGLEDQIGLVSKDGFLYLGIDEYEFRFAVTLISVTELDY